MCAPRLPQVSPRYLPLTRRRFGGAYGSLASCGVLPLMSSDVYLVTMEEGGAARRVVASKVSTSGAQPMPRAYASLVLMTSGELQPHSSAVDATTVTRASGQLLLWGGGSVVCSRLQGRQPVNCAWSYEATVFLCVARPPHLTSRSHSPHTVPRLNPDTWVWTALQAASAAAPQPSLYPVAQAGPDNSLFVYSGCAVSPQQRTCSGSALSSAAFFGSISLSSSVTWASVDSAASSAPLYGACAASPWPHASFEPDASYSHSGAAIVAGGITLSSAILPSLPLTVFSFDSASALATVGGSALPSNPAPQPRAFSACSLMGISDYFVM